MDKEINSVALPEQGLTEDLFKFLEEISEESHLDLCELGIN